MSNLILTRRQDQGVTLTDENTGKEIGHVKILSVKGKQIRVAFDFASHINIARDEILEPERVEASA